MDTPAPFVLAIVILGLVTPQSDANIGLTLAEMADGTTNWELTSVGTIYTVDSYSPVGYLAEQTILPNHAFDFDYSSGFSIDFGTPLGRITNLTTGSSVPLTKLSYSQHLDRLSISGGLLTRSWGDELQITDLASSSSSVSFAAVNTQVPTAYFQAGAWHQENAIVVTPVPVPEPSSWFMMLLGGCACLGNRRRM